MAHYLVTGRGGSGKTTTWESLRSHGIKAYDADEIPGLARWEDTKTGEPISVDYSGHVDYAKVAWNWNSDTLQAFLDKHSDVFICGSASNIQDFLKSFDAVFILTIKPDIHAKRLETHTSTYGKHLKTRNMLVEQQQQFAKEMVRSGAVPIDANDTPEQNVAQILGYINDHR